MQANSYKPDFGIRDQRQNLDWTNKSYVNLSQPEFQPGTWVHLLELPSTFSFDEALLLCQSDDGWVAWIPNHGEAMLHTSQFCACL